MYYFEEKTTQAQSSVNKLGNEIAPKLRDLLQDHVGQKVIKTSDHDYTKKFRAVLDDFFAQYKSKTLSGYDYGYANIHRIRLRLDYSSLVFVLCGQFQESETGCFYREVEYYLAFAGQDAQHNLDGTLKRVISEDDINLAPAYDYKEQIEMKKQIEQMEKDLRELKSKMIKVN